GPYVGVALVRAGKRYLLDEDRLARPAAHVLVGVDTGPAGAAHVKEHVVVPDLVVADEHLRTAAVGEPDADDVVLDDVVQELRPGGPCPHRDAVAGKGSVDAVLDGEPVDDDFVRCDERALEVGHDRLHAKAAPSG